MTASYFGPLGKGFRAQTKALGGEAYCGGCRSVGVSQNRVSVLGVPMIRIKAFWSRYWVRLFLKNKVSRPNFKGSKNFYESMERT